MKAYRIIAHSIAACVVLQATWIALGTFLLIHDVDGGAVVDKSYSGNTADALHAIFGMGVVPLLAIALLITSFFAKIPGGTKWAGYVAIAVVLQILFAFVSFGVPIVGVLHGVNAFVVLGLAELTARRASVPEVAPNAAAVA